MNLFEFLARIVGDVVFLIFWLTVLLIGTLVWAARLPPDNPVKRVLHALSVRLVAMLGLGAVAIPVQPIPGLDVACDLAIPALMIYLGMTFFREVRTILAQSRQRAAAGPEGVAVETRGPSTDARRAPADRTPPSGRDLPRLR